MGTVLVGAAGLGAGEDTVSLVDGVVGFPDLNIVGDVVGAAAAEIVLLVGDTVQNDHLSVYYMRKTHKFQYAIFA